MKYQIFTRASHVGGKPTSGNKPRRFSVTTSAEDARSICTSLNAKRSRRQIEDGFHYEFADLGWFEQAFGSRAKVQS